jgi:hypothetical protein
MNIIVYFFLFFVIFVFSVITYIKFKFKFWYEQPVFHIYDFQYYLFPPGIILNELPNKNKYCNFKNVETIAFDKLNSYQIDNFVNFIRKNYLKNEENVFLPNKENIIPYFNFHNSKCFFSFYSIDDLLLDVKTNSIIENKKIISVMTTKPVHIIINNGCKDAYFDAYYVDYLCVDKNYRNKGIAPQIIQTHEYNQRLLNKKIKVSLFKREGELTGIVPLCVYNSYGFDISVWDKPFKFVQNINLIEIVKQNIYILIDFIKVNNNIFDITIITEISNLLELIKTQNIYCYVVIQNDIILCAYFFKKSSTFIKKDVEVLSCFSSINCCKDINIFINGFFLSFYKIRKEFKNFKFALIEDISHNNAIIKKLLLNHKPIIVSPTAYFFYNFAYPTFNPNKVLLIE